jgi:cobalt/nickel transport system permease protein
MHMADALLSPAVGGAMWAAAAAGIGYCSRRIRRAGDDGLVPLMGVLGAFVFTAQMINFAIPATGSSGHLGGGLLLAVLLGPHAAFLVIASVLTIQALFFADGGLLALGANIINLGLFPCFVAYPFIYKPLAGPSPSPARIMFASLAAAVVGLQLGAAGVLLQTVASGISALPLTSFALLMLPIHLAIGLVEGLVTAAVVNFVRQADPSLLQAATEKRPAGGRPATRRLLTGLLLSALFLGGVFSWFASSQPDGLEWSIAGVTGSDGLAEEGGEHGVKAGLATLQERLAFLPDYAFPTAAEPIAHTSWPAVDSGTSTAGLVGGLLTLALTGLLGLALRWARRPGQP